ncbi:MAG: hypothetical protein JW973_06620 [Bacteroidales bacterium]|nr:hypothetical protein [Bacteroidales bacterium]
MKTVSIYLRSIEDKGKTRLALFDSNRSGGIDDLITEVPPGAAVVWKPDFLSGIRSITKIYSKTGERNVFTRDPGKRLFCKGLVLQLSKEAKGEEAYTIDYILCNGEKMTVDPYIRIKPPQP